MAAMVRIGYCFGMTEALDPARLSSLPEDLRVAFKALVEKSFELDIERTARLHLTAEKSDLEVQNADLEVQNAFLKEANARLEHLVREFRRARFGPRSEKLDPDQQQLAFEDIEIAIAEVRESVTRRTGASREANVERQQRRSRALPKELPRIERVIEPASIACPCGCGTMAKIGEDRTERLDVTPAQFQVIVTIRPRYACPKGRAGVSQARSVRSSPILAMVPHPQGQAILAGSITRSMRGNSLGSARERRCWRSTLASREAPIRRVTDSRTSAIAISMSSNASCF